MFKRNKLKHNCLRYSMHAPLLVKNSQTACINYHIFSNLIICTLLTVSWGQKNQMRIRIAFRLDSRLWAGFWKNNRAAVRAVTTIQYNNLLFYLLFIILYNTLYNIYNLLLIRLAVITHNWIVIHQPVTIIFIFITVLPQNFIFRSVQSFAYATLLERSAANANRDGFPCSQHPPRDFWRQLKERCRLEPWTNNFFV